MKNKINFLTFKNENPKGLYLVTGEIGSGKSVFSSQILDSAIEAGMKCDGILTPGIFKDGVKMGIEMQDVGSGEKQLFAKKVVLNDVPCDDLRMGQWCMREDVLTWGNECLAGIGTVDVLFLDELGPLEFWRKIGLMAGLDLLDKAAFEYGFAVIRPSLLDEARERFDVAGVIHLDDYDLSEW